jgi:hypothetical protein
MRSTDIPSRGTVRRPTLPVEPHARAHRISPFISYRPPTALAMSVN